MNLSKKMQIFPEHLSFFSSKLFFFIAVIIRRAITQFPLDCAAVARTQFAQTNGIYSVFPINCQNSNCAKQIFCDFQDGEGGYTVSQIYFFYKPFLLLSKLNSKFSLILFKIDSIFKNFIQTGDSKASKW